MTSSNPNLLEEITRTLSNTQSGIKRARAQLNCAPCRQGKLKCNRASPCEQCIKRSREDACIYLPPPTRGKKQHGMKSRVKDLENIVIELMNDNASLKEQTGQPGPSVQPPEDTACPGMSICQENHSKDTLGSMKGGSMETRYVSSSHWTALLDKITEVKQHLETYEDDVDEDESYDEFTGGCYISLGMPPHYTAQELIEKLPPQTECDRLLSIWFNSEDPFLHILHRPTFLETYSRLWKDSESIPVFWLPPSGLDWAIKYQKLAAAGMAIGDLSRPQPYVLECLVFYIQSEFMRKDMHNVKVWLTLGVAVRMALRMGYHRDADHYRQVTVFDGEMRRRVWCQLQQMDTLVSFAIGMPSMVRHIETDTRLPSNFADADISPLTKELPPARPDTELTPVSYLVAKSRIVKIFAATADLWSSITPVSHGAVIRIEEEMHEARDLIPPILRMQPMDQTILDPPTVLMARFNLELMYLKTQCVLYRNFLVDPSTDPKVIESQKTCVQAALDILEYQNTIFTACQPGGQLHKISWYMTSLTPYDFLLAATIVCVWMDCVQKHLGQANLVHPDFTNARNTLLVSYNTWEKHGARFSEAKKAAVLLRATILKISSGAGSHPDTNAFDFSGFNLNEATDLDPLAEIPQPLDQIYGSTYDVSGTLPTAERIDPIVSMFDMPYEIDWTTWDSHVTGQTGFTSAQQWPNFGMEDAEDAEDFGFFGYQG